MGAFSRGLTRYPEATKAEARALWAQGMNANQIARKLGITGDVIVRRWCDEEYRAKYNERARRRYIPHQDPEYPDRFTKGWATRRLQRQS